jgi:hypothetical protein
MMFRDMHDRAMMPKRRRARSYVANFFAPGRLLGWQGGEKLNWRRRGGREKLEARNWKVEIEKAKRREISLCAGRPLRRSEAGRKSVGLLRSK